MNELGMARLRGVIRRRRLPIMGTMVGALVLAFSIIIGLRPGYKASAVIRVLESQPAKEYVAPTVAEQVGERLKSLRLAVMARPIVMQAAAELGVFQAFPHDTPDEVVDDMRSRMD